MTPCGAFDLPTHYIIIIYMTYYMGGLKALHGTRPVEQKPGTSCILDNINKKLYYTKLSKNPFQKWIVHIKHSLLDELRISMHVQNHPDLDYTKHPLSDDIQNHLNYWMILSTFQSYMLYEAVPCRNRRLFCRVF